MEESKFTIRKAEFKEISAIQELSSKLCEYENDIYNNPYMVNLTWSVCDKGYDNFKKVYDNDFLYVAVLDKKIVAYMCLWKHEKEFWNNYEVLEISNLYVEEEYRRKGIGTALVELAKKICEENEIRFIKLKLLSDNIESLMFYKKMGLYDYETTLMFDSKSKRLTRK